MTLNEIYRDATMRLDIDTNINRTIECALKEFLLGDNPLEEKMDLISEISQILFDKEFDM